jgi:hypothetical protein
MVLPVVPACFRSTVSLRRKKNCFSRFSAICLLTVLASSTVVTAPSPNHPVRIKIYVIESEVNISFYKAIQVGA